MKLLHYSLDLVTEDVGDSLQLFSDSDVFILKARRMVKNVNYGKKMRVLLKTDCLALSKIV